jgi:alpha-D-ribose 1-methylphosphonate 5-triphosphate synthase subunit PhnG
MACQREETEPRRRWMAVLARASGVEIERYLDAAPTLPPHVRLRGPETGLIMVRGRAGGAGAPFNLGEMTVTRCSVRMEGSGGAALIGHAYVAGRDVAQAELAARLDAGLQDPALRDFLLERVIAPLAADQAERREAIASRAAATRVQFFTMATMRS